MKRFLLAILFALAASPATATERPNIIVILTDDLGYGDVGPTGGTLIPTPNLDRMANQGATLTSFYSSANICTPARASLLTGRYAVRSGLAEEVIQPYSTHGLPSNEVTIAEMLGEIGYRTALIGKWHLGHQPQHHPLNHGFDSFFGLPYSNDMNPLALYEGREAVEQPVDQATMTRRFTQRAIDIATQESDDPFFIYLAQPMPHIPLFASEAFDGLTGLGEYADVVAELDHETGRLLEALDVSGKARDTIVFFTSDNGPWFVGSTGPYRGRKGTSWDGGYRVPFVAWAPGRIAPGVRSAQAAALIDLLPTIAGLTGAKVPADRAIDGRDIWPVLTSDAPSPHEALWFFNNQYITAARQGPWRMVFQDYYRGLDLPLDQFGSYLLFDIERDPGETLDQAGEHPEVVARLRALLAQARSDLAIETRPPFRLPEPPDASQPAASSQ